MGSYNMYIILQHILSIF